MYHRAVASVPGEMMAEMLDGASAEMLDGVSAEVLDVDLAGASEPVLVVWLELVFEGHSEYRLNKWTTEWRCQDKCSFEHSQVAHRHVRKPRRQERNQCWRSY